MDQGQLEDSGTTYVPEQRGPKITVPLFKILITNLTMVAIHIMSYWKPYMWEGKPSEKPKRT
jgi:hypothetical protein